MVEPGRQGLQVPFADQRRLIAGLLQQFRESLLRPVKLAMGIVIKPVLMAMLSRNHTGTARTAQRIGHKAVRKQDSVPGDPVQVRCMCIARVIAAHHLCRMVIGHDIHDVKRLSGLFLIFVLASREHEHSYAGNGCYQYGCLFHIFYLLV